MYIFIGEIFHLKLFSRIFKATFYPFFSRPDLKVQIVSKNYCVSQIVSANRQIYSIRSWIKFKIVLKNARKISDFETKKNNYPILQRIFIFFIAEIHCLGPI